MEWGLGGGGGGHVNGRCVYQCRSMDSGTLALRRCVNLITPLIETYNNIVQ